MSDVNARIQLELVDGPAQKALADFVKSSGKADKSLDGLNKTLAGTNKTATGLGGSFKQLAGSIVDDVGSKGLASLGSMAAFLTGPFGAAAGIAAAAGVTLQKVFDFTLANERNEQIANSFEAIARSAGLAGDSLKQGLLAATQGLADDDAVLASANKSIIELGSNAGRIPEIMEIARKTTALFGGELIQNFENLSGALASGNTRALRNIGLIIDADEAQKKYAASIGVTATQLSDAGKKQAVQNAALEAAQNKFKDVDETSVQATLAFQKFKVAGGELTDGIARLVSQSSSVATVFNALAKGLALITPKEPLTMVQEYEKAIGDLETKIRQNNSQLQEFKSQIEAGNPAMNVSTGLIRTRIQALEKDNEQTQKAIEIRKAFLSSLDDEARKRGPLKATVEPEKQVNTEAVNKQRLEIAKQYASAEIDLARQTAEQQLAIVDARLQSEDLSAAQAIEMRKAIQEQLRTDEFSASQNQFLIENENLRLAFEDKLLTEADYYSKRDSLAMQYTANAVKRQSEEVKRETAKAKDLKTIEDKRYADTKDTFGSISTLMQSSSRELFAIGKAAALAQAGINIAEGISKAWAIGGPFGAPLAALVATAGAVQVANIASTNPSFAQGGIVPGTSFTGDRVQANVNSGELILNRQQQASLFNQISSGGGSFDEIRTTNALLGRLVQAAESGQSIVIDGKAVFDVVRSEMRSGRTLD